MGPQLAGRQPLPSNPPSTKSCCASPIVSGMKGPLVRKVRMKGPFIPKSRKTNPDKRMLMRRGGGEGRRQRMRFGKEGVMAMVTDPVCGMRIDSEDAAATAGYDGKTYYFCSRACRDAFVENPTSYAA